MRPSFIPRLVNGPFEDPGLFVPMTFRKKALLFDLGDLGALSPGDILKITHVFVSHTHMDHFAGFDQLLRLLLGRGKTLHLFGPENFINNVKGKLEAYTWNLVQNYDEGLNISATEIDSNGHTTSWFNCRNGFAPSAKEIGSNRLPLAYEEPEFIVQTAILDHKIPSLAFAVQERFHVNILKPRLEQLGLEVGPWLSQFKQLLFNNAEPDTRIEVMRRGPSGQRTLFSVGELSEQITRITPGQKIAYVADALYCEDNREKIIELASGADHLYIEAAFLEKDRDVAMEKYHLTARQAGTLARIAKVRALSVFHHSPRYSETPHLLQKEAEQAFQNR